MVQLVQLLKDVIQLIKLYILDLVTGFMDGQQGQVLLMYQFELNLNRKLKLQLRFIISLHVSDYTLLSKIQQYLF